MSREARLARLGLAHLAQDPEALKKKLAEDLAKAAEVEAAWEKERAQIKARRKAAAPKTGKGAAKK